MTKSENIYLIPAGIHADQRGILTFCNEFDMSAVKRFYIVEHPDIAVVRAWQGHRYEQKWFHVIEGAFELAVIKPDNWQQPSMNLQPKTYLLEADHPVVLHIPGGYATGFRAVQNGAKMIVYSDASIETSQKDDYRFDKSLWPEVWM